NIFFTHWEAFSGWPEIFQTELQTFGIQCGHISADLSKSTVHTTILDAIEPQLGHLSILVNNAAYSTRDGYSCLTAEQLDRHYAVSIRATLLLSAEFARRFKKTRATRGSIINLTSGQAQGQMVGELSYGAKKGAITALSLSLS